MSPSENPRWPPSKDTYSVKAMLKITFHTSPPLHRQKDCCAYDSARIKGPFTAVLDEK